LSYTPRYDNGDWIADCDVCGRKYKASALSQRWDGLMCCDDDWEIRQPQDFVRGVPDTQIAPWLRPEPPDYFIPIALTAPTANFNVSSNCSLLVQYVEGPAKQNVTSIVTAILNWARRFPITAGAREVNGSSINTNSIN
jgi:hypothetical protein